MPLNRPGSNPHSGHGHRTWLHLLPQDPDFVPVPDQIDTTNGLLIETGLAVAGTDPDTLQPGPAFARLLAPGSLPMAGRQRGEVRFESGVLRCYPDPGPDGFDTDPPRGYLAHCPSCSCEVEFFRLRFPAPDPMQAACPACGSDIDVSLLSWSPALPVARTELTFGDLEGRPSLLNTEFLRRLEGVWATSVTEVHVTL